MASTRVFSAAAAPTVSRAGARAGVREGEGVGGGVGEPESVAEGGSRVAVSRALSDGDALEEGVAEGEPLARDEGVALGVAARPPGAPPPLRLAGAVRVRVGSASVAVAAGGDADEVADAPPEPDAEGERDDEGEHEGEAAAVAALPVGATLSVALPHAEGLAVAPRPLGEAVALPEGTPPEGEGGAVPLRAALALAPAEAEAPLGVGAPLNEPLKEGEALDENAAEAPLGVPLRDGAAPLLEGVIEALRAAILEAERPPLRDADAQRESGGEDDALGDSEALCDALGEELGEPDAAPERDAEALPERAAVIVSTGNV